MVSAVALLLRVAAVRSGAGSWRHSWSSGAEFVGTDGVPLDLEPVATLALDPSTAAQARARLAELGIDAASARQVEQVATAHGGELLGALATVSVNGAPHDIYVLDNGLVLAPAPKKTDGGKARLLEVVESTSVVDLAAQHRFVPFEDVARAEVLKEVPARVRFELRTGETLEIKESWSGELLAKDSSDMLVTVAAQFVPREIAGEAATSASVHGT